ncbi:hypothetical protein PN398_06700 [Romboutsia sp. 1001216sp1]|uniref:hypothetical protein n=1 Tax=Romboutsia sp. 1001216sp1 TaxID=2986997 RepID=UPI00232F8320|nr:hypothetical protein [Romboutsia sp. 1001216sp1]MDB8790403.1 hypothetical protein [Romboutsia sp. 1001216sp1]
MNLILLTSFFIFIFGIFKILNISISDFILDIFNLFESKNETLHNKIKLANSNKKDKWIVSLIKQTKEILEYTNKTDQFSKVCIGATISMVIGIYIAVYIKNYFLIPVLAIGFLTLPFQYIKLTSISYKRAITKELEVSLSVITTAYIRSENIIRAVEETINYIKPPINKVFSEFLIETEYINSDVSKSLLKLKDKINDEIFHEWINAVVACQENIELKNTLNPIVTKLSKLTLLSTEVNNNLYDPLKEFAIMLLLVYGNIPLFYVINKTWYKCLMGTIPGKLTLFLVVSLTFICFTGIIKLTRPIDSSILEEGK